jgi:patatin-like phospholipase/acyl hydrolase
MALELKPGEAANLLSLDGGGVKGISSLTILKAIMDKVQEIEDGNGLKSTEPRLPVDYFHLAGGTSTGGIIALMLFRLRMSTEEAIEAYKKMAESIFGTKGTGAASFSEKPLLVAIDDVVAKYAKLDEDKRLKGQARLVDNKAKM